MPIFHYKAKNLQSKTVRGILDIADEDALISQLRSQGLFMLKCRIEEENINKTKLSPKEISDFAREIGTMIGAGVPLIRAISIIKNRDGKPATRKIYEKMYSQLRRGASLSESMRQQNGAFPELMINMFFAGETGGTLDNTALKMADHYEKENKLQSKVKSAAVYPCILMGLTVVVLLVVFTFVLPTFFKMFEQQQLELPAATKFVIAISNALRYHWLVILIVTLSALLFASVILKLPKVRMRLDELKLKIPKVGKLLRTIYTARFARTLSSLYSSGISMMDALAIACKTTGNTFVEKKFQEAIVMVSGGEQLSRGILMAGCFDRKLADTVLVGEETGMLDSMLISSAESFDYEAESATTRLTTFIEPILIVTMAVTIGFVMISVLLPIYQMYAGIGV